MSSPDLNLSVTKRQSAFINATAFEVLYGGAAGGGKSYGQLVDAMLYALKYPHSKQIIFRRTYPELEKSLIRTALSLYPTKIFRYQKTAHTGVFVNGSLIDFAYCDSEDDVYKYQSAEYDVIRFDELTHFTESMYVYLISRCRGANDFPKHIKSSTNPGGIGHSWVKSRFIDIGAPDTVHICMGTTRIFIPARITDNMFLTRKDPEYVKRLQNLDERDRRALLDGDWDITEGRFFDGFDRKVHAVPPFEVPPEWNRYITLDYGLDMLASYKIAVDFEGRAYVISEIYSGKDNGGEGLIVSKAAEQIKRLCGNDKIRAIYAPPDLWNRQKDSGKSIARLFFENGITLTKVGSARVPGWLEMKEWLHVYDGEDGNPTARLRIFNTCINLLRTISELQCDSTDPSDCSNTPHELTHAPDAIRYFISGMPRASVVTPPSPVYNFEFEKQRKNAGGYGDKINII